MPRQRSDGLAHQGKMNTLEHLLQLLYGALTPLIAVIATYIAYQQYNISRVQARHELYDRRLAVFRSVLTFLAEILREGYVPPNRCLQFYREASEAMFLFPEDVQSFVDELYKKGIDLAFTRDQLFPDDVNTGPTGPERGDFARTKAELFKWFAKQTEVAKELFGKTMRMKT